MFEFKAKSGLVDLIPFCDWLQKKGRHFFIEYYGNDAVTVTVTVVGKRFEVSFFEDHIEFSEFIGNEQVLTQTETMVAEIDSD
ncbi:hypothetical protein [Alsobacter sp. SYSU BS001988]